VAQLVGFLSASLAQTQQASSSGPQFLFCTKSKVIYTLLSAPDFSKATALFDTSKKLSALVPKQPNIAMKDSKKREMQQNSEHKKKALTSKGVTKPKKTQKTSTQKLQSQPKPKKARIEKSSKTLNKKQEQNAVVPVSDKAHLQPDIRTVKYSELVGQYTRCRRFTVLVRDSTMASLQKLHPDKNVDLRLSKEFIQSIRWIAQHLLTVIFGKYAIVNRLLGKQTLAFQTTHAVRALLSMIPYNPDMSHPSLPAYLATVKDDHGTTYGFDKDNELNFEATNAFTTTANMIGISDLNKALALANSNDVLN
jgi:hypothetical protein